jgi:5-methylcytosine-specific restriction endonuclease McrA
VFHVNHVIPKSKNGATDEANLVLQCPYCSLHKSNKTAAVDPMTGVQVNLFHPLQ